MKMKNNAGFTLFEIVIVLAILSILSAVAISDFVSLKKKTDLDNNTQEFVSVLKLAQNKALSSENYSQYGVYLNISDSPNQYILFKGASYALRDPLNDQVYSLQNNMEFYGISLGGGNEIVFDKLTGAPEESGSISIRVKTDTNRNKSVYIADSGAIGFSLSADPLDDNRLKDSRHVQFNYTRLIDIANENIVLTFDNSQTEIIPISTYLSAGELQWQGTVNVGGADQVIEINTQELNANTLFNIRRDRRYNSKSLEVTISGDSSGSLAEYSADGLTASFSSIYVSNFAWQ